MKRIPRLSSDGFFTQNTWNTIANVIEENLREVQIQPGTGVTITRSPGGQTISTLNNGNGGGGTQSVNLPWDAYSVSGIGTETNGMFSNYSVLLYPSTINGTMPSNMFSALTLSGTGMQYVWLACTASSANRQISNTYINSGSTIPTPPAPVLNAVPSSINYLIGVMSNGTYFNIMGRAITLYVTEAGRVKRSNPAPNETPWDIYYTWM
jgi:hypothetical protein